MAAGDPDKKRRKEEAKQAKRRLESETKQAKKRLEQQAKALKAHHKLEKKRLEAGLPADPRPADARASEPERASLGVRYAEVVRGALYVLTGLSLLAALLLGQRDVVVSLDDLVNNLFLAAAGKVVLALLGLALAIYGLKALKIVR